MEKPLAGKIEMAGELDRQALEEMKRGQFMAMEGVVERYQDRLYGTIYRLVNHPEDAADLVQETFVKAMQNVGRFEGRSSLYTWLFRIGVNLALSQRRSRQYRKTLSLEGKEWGRGRGLRGA